MANLFATESEAAAGTSTAPRRWSPYLISRVAASGINSVTTWAGLASEVGYGGKAIYVTEQGREGWVYYSVTNPYSTTGIVASAASGGGYWIRPLEVIRIPVSWAGMVDGSCTAGEAEDNVDAIQSCIALVSALGGGEVYVNPSVFGTDPYLLKFHSGQKHLQIKDGVTLTGEGPFAPGIKLHDDALDGTASTKQSGVYVDSAAYGWGIRNLQIDGNIENQDFDLIAGPGNWITGSHTANAQVEGVKWTDAPSTGKGILENVHSHDWLRGCFVGQGSSVRMINCIGGNSLTDHLYYSSKGEDYPPIGMSTGFHGYGYWEGIAVTLTSHSSENMMFTDFADNPCATLTAAVSGGPYSFDPTAGS